MKKIFVLISIALFQVLSSCKFDKSITYYHPGGMHPEPQIIYVRDMISTRTQPYYDAYKQLIKKANTAFEDEIHAVADFSVPGAYIDAEGHKRMTAALKSDAFNAYACALAWQLSGEEKYASRALEFLMAWANLNKDYSDYDGTLAMTCEGTGMINAGELLYHFPT